MATIEWTLDMWEWQGVGDRRLEVDAEDFQGMDDEEIRQELYDRVSREAENYLHYVLSNLDEVVDEIQTVLATAA